MAKAKEPEFEDEFGRRWHANIPQFQRRIICAREGIGDVPTWEQRKAIIQTLFTDDEFSVNEWTERRLQTFSRSMWNVWAGCAGIGKSAEAAMIGLEYWIEAPWHTAVIVTSTTKDMLRKRIWGYITQYHGLLSAKNVGHIGDLVDTSCLIRWKEGDTKNGIFGIAVGEGSVQEAVNNIIGIHTKRVLLILDEFQGVREAIMSATRNMAKNPEFRFLGLGNPEDKDDIMGRSCQPVKGWESVKLLEDEEWEIHPGPVEGIGLCSMFYCHKSPGIRDPVKYHYLITQKQIDADLRSVRGNTNDPKYQSQTLGVWPAMGLSNTVLDTATVDAFKCKEKAIWTHGFKRGAALDPAFEEGGDDKVLQFFKYGWVDDDLGKRWVVDLNEWLLVPINANSKTPVHYQIMEFCRDQCREKNIQASEFALDSSGEGGGLKAICDKEWGSVVGVEFGGRASDMPVKAVSDDGNEEALPANQVYDRRVSELNLMLREFAQSNGLRGLSNEAANQACARKTFYKNKKYSVETKKDLKKRIRRSCDNLDAAAIAIELARQRGCVPAISFNKPQRGDDWQNLVRKADSLYSSSYAA
jgi:hypothetical protein